MKICKSDNAYHFATIFLHFIRMENILQSRTESLGFTFEYAAPTGDKEQTYIELYSFLDKLKVVGIWLVCLSLFSPALWNAANITDSTNYLDSKLCSKAKMKTFLARVNYVCLFVAILISLFLNGISKRFSNYDHTQLPNKQTCTRLLCHHSQNDINPRHNM